jgi:tetratricopeptide (TPR) repeat protein
MLAATETRTLTWQAPGSARQPPFAKYLPLMRAAAAAAPARTDLQLHLAQALFRTRAMAEIVERLRPALADSDSDPKLLYFLGRAALATNNNQLALEALGVGVSKGFADACGYMAEALARLNRADEALDALGGGLEHSPTGYESLSVVADALRNREQIERLWASCIRLRERGAWGGWFSTVMASTAALLGLEDELKTVFDPPRWFSTKQPALPADFNQGLVAELLATHSTQTAAEPAKRINQLEVRGGPRAQELFANIRKAVEDYTIERQTLSDHPIMTHRPASATFHAWSLVTHDSHFNDWHVHRAGWLSGVYYVSIPQAAASGQAHPGAIDFGLFPFGGQEKKLQPYQWQVTPEPGLLLLFPSYYAHRTWPTGIGDFRISLAFDVRCATAAD